MITTQAQLREFLLQQLPDNKKNRITPKILRDVLTEVGKVALVRPPAKYVYATVADLRTVTEFDGGAVYFTQAMESPGEGGGAQYTWSSTSTDADDGGRSTVKPTSIAAWLPGRFKLWA